MAETWLKMRSALLDSPKVLLLAKFLKVNVMTARGIVWTWLDWIDRQTTDGNTELSAEEINLLLGFRGAAEALVRIGWLTQGSDGSCSAVEFGKHCGESAKMRALSTQRQATRRMRRGDVSREMRDVSPWERDVSRKKGDNVTHAALPRVRVREENKGVGNTTVYPEAVVAKPPPPPQKTEDAAYGEWKAALCRAVPALAEYETLPPDVEDAAARAYKALPSATKYEALLAAYYADRLQEDARRRRFWRPTGELFFDSLSDVIHNHAERWALETGWKRRHAGKKSAAAAEKVPPQDAVSRQQWAKFKAEMKEHLSPQVEGKQSTRA